MCVCVCVCVCVCAQLDTQEVIKSHFPRPLTLSCPLSMDPSSPSLCLLSNDFLSLYSCHHSACALIREHNNMLPPLASLQIKQWTVLTPHYQPRLHAYMHNPHIECWDIKTSTETQEWVHWRMLRMTGLHMGCCGWPLTTDWSVFVCVCVKNEAKSEDCPHSVGTKINEDWHKEPGSVMMRPL